MNRALLSLFLLCVVVLPSMVFCIDIAPEEVSELGRRSAPKVNGLGSLPLDLTGEWLGDYDATPATNFVKILVQQDDNNNILGYFESNNQITFNVTVIQDESAAQGQGVLFEHNLICGYVGAGMYIWDNNHFTFVWGSGNTCGAFYPGQSGEFYRNIGNC